MSDESILDMQTIDQLKELVDDDDPDFFVDIIQGYIETAGVSIKELSEAVNSQDIEKVASAAHCLKGSSGNIGAVRMQKISYELEKFGKKDNLTGASELLTNLEEEFSKVTVVLEKEI